MKKLLTTLLIASVAITGLFAYTSPSVILDATAEKTDYTFKLQKLNSEMTSWTDFDGDYTENVILSSTEKSTNAYTVSTTANGNMPSDITFTTTVTTGNFKDKGNNADYDTSWYPTIEALTDSATASNTKYSIGEEVSYDSKVDGAFNSASKGEFSTTFIRGIHNLGTEIARFKLHYKAENIAAGTYLSTTTVTIATN